MMQSISRRPGQIQVILGPMFSGKSTELLRRIKRYTIANRTCLVIKYHKDTRYSTDSLGTHDKQFHAARPTGALEDVYEQAKSADVIGIDEGQFFPDIVPFCEAMANEGKIVVVAALDGTFQRKPFGEVLYLIPLAESVTKLNAVCMICYKDASFSKRLGDETEVELIGGADRYISVCRNCFHKTPMEAKSKQKQISAKRSRVGTAITA